MGAWWSALAMASVVSPAACASSYVAPAASAAFLVVSAICCSMASMCIAVSISALSAALLAAAFAAACCFLSSFNARFSSCAWSSCSVAGSWHCPVRFCVSTLACFPLSGSRRSRRWRISGVRGMRSLPLLPRDPDPTLARETELKLSLSLFLPSVPLPSGASGA